MADPAVSLRADGIVKRYGGTTALHGVDFAVEAGEVHVLIGENGAGKSTLMKILAGVEQPTAGSIQLNGAPVLLGSVQDAARLGIGMVHQELNLCPNLTVAENLFLTRRASRAGRLIDRQREDEEARRLLARLGQPIDPARKVESLSIGEQQLVEIARVLAEDCRILILDEPTTALSANEVETLFRVVRELTRDGVAVIYISHRLEELLRIGDRISILRDGRMVAQRAVAEASVAWIVGEMLGDAGRLERHEAARRGPAVLAFDRLCRARSPGKSALNAVSATVHAGEVVAAFGLLGSGRTELLEAVAGLLPLAGGQVRLNDSDVTALPIADRVERGMAFVPEDRKAQGLFGNMSVAQNVSLADLSRFAQFGTVDAPAEQAAVAAMIARLGIKVPSPQAPIGALSGGNQQKALIGRALMRLPQLLLLDEPSRGIDVGARADLFSAIRQLAAEGLAVVFSTSDVLEALAIADRVLVIAGGTVVVDIAADAADEATLVGAANAVAASLEVHA